MSTTNDVGERRGVVIVVMLMLQNRQPTTQGRMMMDGASERAREEKQCGVGRAGGWAEEDMTQR